MDTEIQTLRYSFHRLSPRADALAQHFYDLLFTRHPEVLPLFAGVDFDDQRRKLVRALALVVRHLEQPDFLRAYLQGLGAIHLAYGVATPHYRAVTECLLASLAHTAGSSWTEAEAAAWQLALDEISKTMLTGAARLGAGAGAPPSGPVTPAGPPSATTIDHR
jgi:hemoglobin-like flavoprotein